jgi:feruloyl-CoA synthase
VTPGYHRRPDLTAAAFDDEGFYRTGDAVRLIDEAAPEAGLRFDGRIAEDFKLSTGTWVSVGTLRPALLSAADGLLQDAVLGGHDGDYVGALAWLNLAHARRLVGAGDEADARALVGDRAVRGAVSRALERLNRDAGSSRQIARLLCWRTRPRWTRARSPTRATSTNEPPSNGGVSWSSACSPTHPTATSSDGCQKIGCRVRAASSLGRV